MSAYDDAVAYLDAEVYPRCDYDIYSDMRDIVDEMEAENAKLRELTKDACTVLRHHYNKEWFDGTVFAERMRELGIEVDE